MPRIARVMIPDIPYHITQRGNYRQNVFDDGEDKKVYLSFFEEYRKKYELKVYAWVLMDNHVHFIVEPADTISIAKVFKCTHMRYSHYYNKKKGAKGHLWQGRFYSCPLDAEHLYEAVRYVELNPIKACMVSHPQEYLFSSSRRILGDYPIQLDSVSKYFEINDWEEYLKEEVDSELVSKIRANSKTGRPSGGKDFISILEKRIGRVLVPKAHGRPMKVK
jgi:putative transposase